MSLLDMQDLAVAFSTHTTGATHFTRRMAIALAAMDGSTPRELVLRCERLGLLRRGSWDWFADNGGITSAHIAEAKSTPPTGDRADV